MAEFVLALPLLLMVFALIFLMGSFHVRKQQVVVASRYTVWRSFDAAAPDDAALNRRELGNRAVSVEQTHHDGSGDVLRIWVDAAAAVDEAGGVLADELILRQWSHDRSTRVEATYESPLAIGEDFGKEMTFSHGRAGRQWVRGQASEWAVLMSLYYPGLDATFVSAAEPDETMADAIGRLVHGGW